MTNKRLGAQLSQEEFLNWIGLRLTMTLEHVKGDLSNLWDTEYDSDTVFQAPRYGERFGMRFKNISSAFRLGEDITLRPDTDPWHFVRDLLEAFKYNMRRNF